MKQRIQFKKNQPKEYTSNRCQLLCRGIVVRELESPKLAKLAAERWNTKHQNVINGKEIQAV